MNTAIVLEPTGALREMVAEAKRWVTAAAGARTYLVDPPHATLLAGSYPDAARLEPLLAAISRAEPPVRLRTTGMMVFEHDTRAGGAHTVALRVEPTAQLSHLQRRIADALAGEQARASAPDATDMPDPRWRESMSRYGWPFVGAHWVPHLTIAALDGERDAALIRSLMARPATFECSVTMLWLWDVIRGHAHPRSTFPLSGAD